jgi:hypothetical protein
MIRATEQAAPTPAPSTPATAPPVLAPLPVVVAPPPRPPRLAADVAGVMTAGIGGDAPSLGPSIRGHLIIVTPLSVHIGASLGVGTIDDAEARMTTTRITAGGRWVWLTVARDVSFDVGLDVLAVNHVVRRTAPAADRDRWLGGAHADLGIAWRVSALVEPFANGGLDGVAGNTPITVAGRALAHIPPVRAVAEAGVRLRF